MPLTAMIDELRQVEEQARSELAAAGDEASLEAWRVAFLGRKGRLTGLLRRLIELPPEQRRDVGAAANRLKQALEEALEARRAHVETERLAAATAGRLDVTLPGRPRRSAGCTR